MAMTEEEVVERRNVTPQQLAIIVGALILVLLLVYLFVIRGGGDGTETVANPPLPEVTAEPTPTDLPDDGAGEGGGKGPVETFEVFAPRDPFKPLVTERSGGGGTGDGGTGDGGTGDGGTGDGGTGDGGTGDGGTGGTGGQNVQGHTVRLIDIIREGGTVQAQIQVDSTVYTVDEGETFAGNFKLLSVSGQCASMLFGDDQFTLCEGEEILK